MDHPEALRIGRDPQRYSLRIEANEKEPENERDIL